MSALIKAIFVSLLFISVSAHAQQWYKVELVVFENLNPNASEQASVMPLLEPAANTPDSQNNRVQPASRGDLSGVAERLRNSSGYRVISHDAWRQAALSRNGIPAINIDHERVQGQLRLYIATYLFADVDLWLVENRLSSTGEGFESPRNHQLKEVRRVKSRELHYFDHPRFGAILRVDQTATPDSVLQNMTGSESYSLD